MFPNFMDIFKFNSNTELRYMVYSTYGSKVMDGILLKKPDLCVETHLYVPSQRSYCDSNSLDLSSLRSDINQIKSIFDLEPIGLFRFAGNNSPFYDLKSLETLRKILFKENEFFKVRLEGFLEDSDVFPDVFHLDSDDYFIALSWKN